MPWPELALCHRVIPSFPALPATAHSGGSQHSLPSLCAPGIALGCCRLQAAPRAAAGSIPHCADGSATGLGRAPGARCHLAAGPGRDALWAEACSAPFLTEGNYTAITQHCWDYFVYLMRNVLTSELCEWKVISRYGPAGL